MNNKGNRYYYAIAMLYVSMLLISNTLAIKLISLSSFIIPAGILCFPLSYLLNDVIVEIYGYEKTRNVIWLGFICLGLMTLLYTLAVYLPPASFWQDQKEFEKFFSQIPRITLASFFAYLVGSFLNAYVMSRMKIYTAGKKLWTRTIGSTIIGEGADSLVFNLIAFYGVFPNQSLIQIIISGFVLKTLYEILMTPLTYKAISYLKRAEEEDKFDKGVNYNPFKID